MNNNELSNTMKKEAAKFEKEKRLKREIEELDGVGDKLGLGIDPKIKETVATLILLGINTSGSCEGHPDRALAAPWIDIDAPNEPDENFVGENKIYQKYADKYSLPFEDVKYAVNIDVWREAYNEAEENGENPELAIWRQENNKLKVKLDSLLDEFYNNRQVEENDKITIEVYGAGSTNRLHNGGSNYGELVTDMTSEQQAELPEKLRAHQAEMTAFTDFLKEKYFNEN